MRRSVTRRGGGLSGTQFGELLVNQQHARTQEFDQVGQGGFLDLGAGGADGAGSRHFREVGQDLCDHGGQGSALERSSRPDAVEKAPDPRAQRLDALGQRGLVGRQQGLEFHLLRREDGVALLEQLSQRA